MKVSYPRFLSVSLVICLGLIIGSVAASKKEELKVKVLENTSFKDCAYSGNVTIEVRYRLKHFTSERGTMILEGSQDGVIYNQLKSRDVGAGRGTTLMNFDAGECTVDIRVRIE